MKERLVWAFLLFSGFLSAQETFQVEKLQDFAELYGVVRYFHPSDQATEIDWQAFAIHGVNEIAKVKNQQEFELKLQELFSPIAPSISFNNTYYKWDSTAPYPVYWIHNGLGIGTKSDRKYYSDRYNKSKNITGVKSFAIFIPLQFENTGKLKLVYEGRTQDGNAFGYIKLFDDKKNTIYFSDDKNPFVSNEWQQRTIITSEFANLNMALISMFSEGGDSQFRNIQLYRQSNDQTWTRVDLPPLTDDSWFLEPKGDYVLKNDGYITIMEKVESKQLHSLQNDVPLDKNFVVKLSNGLNVIVPTVVYANEQQTLPSAQPQQLSHLKEILKEKKDEKFNSDVGLANIIITWNVFRHFYPYQSDMDIDWDKILTEALRKDFYNTDKLKHKLSLEILTENFSDAHININNEELDIADDSLFSTPVKFTTIDDEIVIQKTFNNYNGILKPGDIVTEVNEKPAGIFLDSLCQYISGNTQWKRVKAVKRFNTGPKDSELVIKTASGKTARLIRNIPYQKNKDFFYLENDAESLQINDDIFYINLNKVNAAEIDSLMLMVKNFKGLIIDLRGYPQDIRHRIFSYFPAIDTAKWLCNWRILQPDFSNTIENCNSYKLNITKAAFMLTTKNILLIDERSISNAELFAQLVKYYKIAKIVGRPSAGANGNVNLVELLSGFSLSFTGMKVVNPDGSKFHTIGVIPDYYVKESIDDVMSEKDPIMNKAIEILETQFD